MIFWIGILIAVFCAWMAVKMGFYGMWALMFNIVVSIFLSVELYPVFGKLVPASSETDYGAVFTIIAIAVGVFVVIQGASYSFIVGQFKVSFPVIFDNVLSGVLGFLAGFLLWSFITFLIVVSPVSEGSFMKKIELSSQVEKSTVPYMCWWCDFVGDFVRQKDKEGSSKDAVEGIMSQLSFKKHAKALRSPAAGQLSDANSPVSVTDSNREPALRVDPNSRSD